MEITRFIIVSISFAVIIIIAIPLLETRSVFQFKQFLPANKKGFYSHEFKLELPEIIPRDIFPRILLSNTHTKCSKSLQIQELKNIWRINNTTLLEGGQWVINCSIHIMNGGALIIRNAKVIIGGGVQHESAIEVFPGGNLTIINSTLLAANWTKYYIHAHPDSKILFKKSIFSGLGVPWRGEEGITLNTYNAIVTECTIIYSYCGICLDFKCHGAIISNNTIYYCEKGIYLKSTSDNVIINNMVRCYSYGMGLIIFNSSNNIIANNDAAPAVYVIDSYNNTFINNTIRGKPILYLEKAKDLNISGEFGEVILIHCENVTLENIKIRNASIGIELWKSNRCRILNCNLTEINYIGILLMYSHYNIIERTVIKPLLDYHRDYYRIPIGIKIIGSKFNEIHYSYVEKSARAIAITNESVYNRIANNVISKCTIGVFIKESEKNTVERNYVKYCCAGVRLVNASDNLIMSNILSNCEDSCLDIIHSQNNYIVGNFFEDSYFELVTHQAYENLIFNNIFKRSKRIAVFIVSSSNNAIIANIISSSKIGIYLEESRFNTLENNTIISNEVGIRISPSDMSYKTLQACNSIRFNIILMNKIGVYLRDISDNVISHNIIANNTKGIHIVSSPYNVIKCNVIINNVIGIHCFSSRNFMFENYICNNTKGLVLDHAFRNWVAWNNITNNDYGIYLWESYNNTILGNMVLNNTIGLLIDSSWYNKITLNAFINNGIHTNWGNCTNFWTTMYVVSYVYNGKIHESILGNYWSNYTGLDNDYDGVGDAPYGNDTHPLIKPPSFYSPLDADEDNLNDFEEELFWTNPNSNDTDKDGIIDFNEIFVYHTDPLLNDTDHDGFDDGTEILAGTDPCDPRSHPQIAEVHEEERFPLDITLIMLIVLLVIILTIALIKRK